MEDSDISKLTDEALLELKSLVDTAVRNRGLGTRTITYNKTGLEGERAVLDGLARLGKDIVKSEDIEDITKDIDFYLDGVPVSLKTEHTGLRYGDIYFELSTQHYTEHNWEEYPGELENLLTYDRFYEKYETSYGPSIWFYSEAEMYAIFQGKTVTFYRKKDLQEYVKENGWDKVLPLGKAAYSTQNGRNTFCGFLKKKKLEHLEVFSINI